MAWLHTWAGLLAGWVLFFVFLTGTLSYLRPELDRWTRPELPLAANAICHAADLLALADARLRTEAPGAESWVIRLPGGRWNTDLTIGWRPRPAGKGDQQRRETLDIHTGLPVERAAVRKTGGGEALYRMHYMLHYLPGFLGVRIVGVCTMFMLVAILSGVVTHKKIFRDFFTFRPAKGQRSWLDGHNLASVMALPFHVMIAWSGLILFLFAYMPVAANTLYSPATSGGAEAVLYGHGALRGEEGRAGHAAALLPLAALLPQVEQRWGSGRIESVSIENPGHSNAVVTFSPSGSTGLRWSDPSLRFAGASGRFLGRDGDPRWSSPRTGVETFQASMLGLHTARLAGPVLRLLFIVAGLAGTAMIGTGLVLWSVKRKAKLAKGRRPNLGMAAVDVLNLGTIIGLPIGIAAYFWANRLIPVGIEGRGEWEVHAMFIAWCLTFLCAIWRPKTHAWIELACLAAAAWGLLPLLNALTTNRHLGVTIPAGDWVLASIDLGMLATGLFFALLARNMARKQAKTSGAPVRRLTATPLAEVAE